MKELRVICPDCGQALIVREGSRDFRCVQCGGISPVKDNKEKDLIEELKRI